jgi:hypothetical protein
MRRSLHEGIHNFGFQMRRGGRFEKHERTIPETKTAVPNDIRGDPVRCGEIRNVSLLEIPIELFEQPRKIVTGRTGVAEGLRRNVIQTQLGQSRCQCTEEPWSPRHRIKPCQAAGIHGARCKCVHGNAGQERLSRRGEPLGGKHERKLGKGEAVDAEGACGGGTVAADKFIGGNATGRNDENFLAVKASQEVRRRGQPVMCCCHGFGAISIFPSHILD